MIVNNVVQIVVMNNCLRVLCSGLTIDIVILIFIGSFGVSLNGQPNLAKIICSGMN